MNKTALANNISKPSNIGECIKGNRKKAGGFHWREATEEEVRMAL